ncbi:MAG: hypothetical protein E7521_00725 [Ruminococcaceae bacterium]|nr:hypothetical protein [Oscillospiraceae bacterium]
MGLAFCFAFLDNAVFS